MINVLHLLWIIPLSMIVSALALTCIASVMAGAEADERMENFMEKSK